ncbi:MAG TPA: ribonuclease III, partial [Candidatus Cloacimonas sp.]|nr:ribonuclease III [Candidatus Cloacimonas sp.]
KVFTIEVRVGNKLNCIGKGNTKKAAHQEAARIACQKLGI